MSVGSNRKDLNESPSCTTYDLRSRTIIRKRGNETPTDTPTPRKRWNCRNDKAAKACTVDFDVSQESVSMLQECYQEEPKNDFPDTMDTELDVIDIYSEEEIYQTYSMKNSTVETSTQTDSFHFRPELTKEKEIAKHAKFISSVVKLKSALSSKKKISDKNLSTILQGEEEYSMEIEEQGQTVHTETIGYVLRDSDIEKVFRETVLALLQHLESILEKDFLKIAVCWKHSVYETVVDLLKQAIEYEAGVWKMVASFLCRIIRSIVTDEKSKNTTLESKTIFVLNFCQSPHLSYSIVRYILKKLKKLKTIKRFSDSPSSVYLAKNSFHLLRILECCLEFLKNKVKNEKLEEVFIQKPQNKNYNVLEMWQKHWNRDEGTQEKQTKREWEMAVSDWCSVLDEILLHCISHIPVLSMAVDRCGNLAKEIFQTCYPSLMEEQKTTGSEMGQSEIY